MNNEIKKILRYLKIFRKDFENAEFILLKNLEISKKLETFFYLVLME